MKKVLEALESGEPFELLCEMIVESACQVRHVAIAALELAPDARQSSMREVARYTTVAEDLLDRQSLFCSKYPIKRFGVIVGQLVLWSHSPLGRGSHQRAGMHAFWGGIAFERERSGVQLQALLERLHILNELNKLIISDAPLKQLAYQIARKAASRFVANVGLTLLVDPENPQGQIRIVGAYGCPTEVLERTPSSRHGFLGKLLSEGGQETVTNLIHNPLGALDWLRKFGIHTIHAGCIEHHDEPSGIVIVGFGGEPPAVIPEKERFDEFLRAAAVALVSAQTRDKLLSYSEHLEELVEERTIQLEVESERAQEANRAKSRFLANMSHELRTPLTAIVGFTSLMSEGVYGEISTEQSEALSAVTKSSNHLKNLISDILDLARIESGKESAQPKPIEVAHTLAHVHKLMQQTAAEKKISLSLSSIFSAATIFADQKHLNQILINLISNAIKYTRPKGRVAIDTEIRGDTIAIRVSDSGVGISRELLEHLFDRFSRGDDEYSRQQEGTGIGLAIVQQLVHLNDGQIEVSSEVGRGSVFTVSFPLVERSDEKNSAWDGKSGEHVSLRGRSILVLEDDANARHILKKLLETRGATVILSESIASAVPHIEDESLNLIITDIGLHRENGLSFIEQVRQHSTKIPIIVLSGSAFQEDKQRALDAGANDFVAKPFDARSLLTSTARLLGLELR